MSFLPCWPAGFLPTPDAENWEGAPFDSRQAFAPEAGPPMFRRRVTAEAWQYSGRFPLADPAEQAAFWQFWREIEEGSKPFLWRDPETGEPRKWQFAAEEPVRTSNVSDTHRDFQLRLIRLPSTPWWAWMIPADRTVAPRAAYDFKRGLYDAGNGPIGRPAAFTFTRASQGRYFDETGTIVTAAIDVPRFDRAPDSFERRGLLIEPARSNLLIRSSEPANAAWFTTLATKTVYNSVYYGPTAILTTTAASGAYVSLPSVTTTGAVTFSAIVGFSGGSTGATLWIGGTGNLYGATISPSGTWSGVHPNISAVRAERLRPGWWRASITTTPPAWPITPAVIVTGATGAVLQVAAPQVEQGATPTSYIPTTTAAVARAADTAGLVAAHGLCDVRVIYDDGPVDTLLSYTLPAGWWPPKTLPHIAGIAIFDAGALA